MKKLYISADIEGTCGIAHWQETNTNNEYSVYFQTQMTKEVAAACKGALRAGYGEILVKDAHDSARNIFPNLLPKEVSIIRGWARDPYSMMTGLDDSFDAVIMTGYHSAANTNSSPLAHTMTTEVFKFTINGVKASEFMINSYAAQYIGVPVVMLTGDKALCETAKELSTSIKTVPVSEGRGNCSRSIHPDLACERIEQTAFEALSANVSNCLFKLPDEFNVEVSYKNHFNAYKASFYPGAYAVDPATVGFSTKDFLDVLKFMLFNV